MAGGKKKEVVVVKAPQSSTFRINVSLKRKYAHLIELIDAFPIQSEKSMFIADLMMDGLKFREMVNTGRIGVGANNALIPPTMQPPALVTKELTKDELEAKFDKL